MPQHVQPLGSSLPLSGALGTWVRRSLRLRTCTYTLVQAPQVTDTAPCMQDAKAQAEAPGVLLQIYP
jgi:hypothetical protein